MTEFSCQDCPSYRKCDFTRYRHLDFCEGNSPFLQRDLLSEGSYTEWGNAFSSLALSFLGLLCLFYRPYHQTVLIRLNYWFLIWNGFGSFAYHFSGMNGLGSFDGIPMLIIVSIGMWIIIDELVQEIKNKSQSEKEYIKSILASIPSGYLIAALLAEQYDTEGIGFRVLFALPFTFFLGTQGFFYFHVEEYAKTSSLEEIKSAKKCILLSVSIGLSGLLMWILDLELCQESGYFLVWGHWWWHIALAYYGVGSFAMLNFYKGNNYKKQMKINFILNFIPYTVETNEKNRSCQDEYSENTTSLLSNSNQSLSD